MIKKEIWTLSEITQHQKMKDISFELLSRGRGLAEELGVPLSSVVLGGKVTESDIRELIYRGADKR